MANKTKSKNKPAENSESLLAQAKGIEPLIIGIFIIIIYWLASAVMLFLSYKFGRL